MRSSSRDTTDLLRGAGGVLLAAGCVVLYVRKVGHHSWGDVVLLLVLLIPAVSLYALALGGKDRGGEEGGRPSRGVLMIASILLAPLTLLQMLSVLGVGSLKPLETAAVFATSGLIAAYGASRARVPYAALLAGLALLVAWLIVWVRILDHPSTNTFRILLLAGAAVLFLMGARLERVKAIGSSEVATAGGVAAVGAGVLGVFVGTVAGVMRPFTGVLEGAHASGSTLSLTHPSGLQNFGWDLYLLVVSLALILVGERVRSRGLGYVGGFGALLFVYSVALEVTRIESGKVHTSSLAGWPLALVVLGVLGLAMPLFAGRKT